MKKPIISFILFILFIPTPATFAINAVASIKKLSGEVKIQRLKRNIPGRKGLVLNDKDIVITGHKAKTTLLFRDGSEIRLFPNTRFIIQRTQEIKGAQRGFLNNFMLKAGSFWGKFTKNRQKTQISTPTATCGIKGTSVSFAQRNGKMDVSLSTGTIELENEDEKIQLPAGKMVKGITMTGSIQEKIEDIPYRLMIKPDNNKINIPLEGNEGKIDFTVQIINIKTKQNVERSGQIYLSLKMDKIVLPERVVLNERGFVRFTASIKPFKKEDYGNGKIEIVAIAEGEKFMDIGSGQTMLIYDIPKKFQKTIRIDATSGKID